jgi:hypothetical protein
VASGKEERRTDMTQRNRKAQSLPLLWLEVEDQNGVQVFDPNKIVLWDMKGGAHKLRSFTLEPDLENIVHKCVIYRSDNIEVRLTIAQLHRLINLSLRPLEYFQLVSLFGMAHEWHEDFYDPETGAALQPRR